MATADASFTARMASLGRASGVARRRRARELATPEGTLARLERLAAAVARANLSPGERLALEVECCAAAATLHTLRAREAA